MLFDTDILIWVQKGNKKAAQIIEKEPERKISVLTYMELMQCPRSRTMQKIVKGFLREFNFEVLPLTENIGHRAAVYIEEHSLSSGIRAGDAIVAATAVEHNLTLLTSNRKHFLAVSGLNLKIFRP